MGIKHKERQRIRGSDPESRDGPNRGERDGSEPDGEPSPDGESGKTGKKHNVFLEELLFLIIKIAAIAAIAAILLVFIFGVARYEDTSMAPAVHEGDLVLYYRLDKSFVASELAVVEYEGTLQIRRVIATAGDEVDVGEDGLVINGALQAESYTVGETVRYDTAVEFPMIIPDGYVFVLADSRENATDSRVYGLVSVEDTLGKVITIVRRRGF